MERAMKNLEKAERRGPRTAGHGSSHYDNQGHIDPERAARLLGLTATPNEAHYLAFIESAASEDDLAEELAQVAVVAMTSGDGRMVEDMNGDVEEDWGGPFVVTSASREFAGGTDDSNIAEATREPFPTT
jgi:hypothetical protein